jgi:hypothetical protein
MTKLKIRTVSQLNEELDAEIAWRRKELIYIKSLIEKDGSSYRTVQDTLVRSAITILYAHWEGFVKNSATFYVEFVFRQNLRYSELSTNFLTLDLETKLGECSIQDRQTQISETLEALKSDLEISPSNQWKNAIQTRSNLNSKYFKEIVMALGLEYSFYETKEKLIDEILLGSRNKIAHGEKYSLDRVQYMNLHHEVIGMMDIFKNQIENSANLKTYKST